MIHIASRAGRAVFRAIDLRAHLQQVDQRAPRPQLREPQFALLFFDAATEHVAVKARHRRNVGRPNHNMVDLANMNLHIERLPWLIYQTENSQFMGKRGGC